jgi:hypothetical protein
MLSHCDEDELFGKVLCFLKEFFNDQNFHKKVEINLKRAKTIKNMGSSPQNEGILSFKKMNIGSRICFEGEVTRKESPCRQNEGRAVRAQNKKISIFVMEEDFS